VPLSSSSIEYSTEAKSTGSLPPDVWLTVTCGLTACIYRDQLRAQRSALSMGKPLPLPLFLRTRSGRNCCRRWMRTASHRTFAARSTGTVPTSAKARLTSVAISVSPYGESVRDRQENVIICSLAHCRHLANQCELECGPMPNVMVALLNIGGALCSTPQSLADTRLWYSHICAEKGR